MPLKMITFICNSLKFLTAALVLASLSGCDKRDELRPTSGESSSAAGPAVLASQTDRKSSMLLATMQKNFDQATRGGSVSQNRMTKMPSETAAGLICTPSRLSKNAPSFRIVLPPRSEDREGALAVIAPNGSMRLIYTSYGIDTDPEDLVIPSKSIDWERARDRNSFDVSALSFDALIPDESKSKRLFREKGVYQFALLNSVARDLLELEKRPFWVIGGCVVHWQP
jgi:hypothetical protein